MIGWRARLGFLVPPGNPTVEAEMTALAPAGVSLHFHRLFARGVGGALDGQTERTRAMIDSIDAAAALLAMVKPDVVVLAHTASSYHLGRAGEVELVARLEQTNGRRFVTAFGCVLRALERLGLRKVALAAPYARETMLAGKAHLEAHGFEVVRFANLEGIANIYDTTAEDAYRLARSVDAPEAEAVFLTGTGMPTLAALEALEDDLGKPVVSSASAMLWHALRLAGVAAPIGGHGRLLTMGDR